MTYAAKYFERIRNCRAFRVTGATRINVNQHVTKYRFPDESVMQVHSSGECVIFDYRGERQSGGRLAFAPRF